MEQDDGDPHRRDIAARIAALRRDAYSRSGSEASFAALRDLEQELLEMSAERDRPAELPVPVPTATVGLEPRALARRRFSAARVGMIVLTAVIVAAIGFSLGRTSPAPASIATSTLPAEAQRGSATLALLETPQRAADMPPFSLGSDIIPATVHILPTGLQGEVTIYGARSYQQLVCLVAVTGGPTSTQLGESAETCSTVHQFVTDGIRLRITTSELVTDDAGFSNFAYFQFLWTGNGAITDTSNHYPFPAAPHL